MAAGDLAFKENKYDVALAYYKQAVSHEEEYGGEGDEYQVAPRLGLSHLCLYKAALAQHMLEESRFHLKEEKGYFRELSGHTSIAIGQLYGQYGLAQIAFLEGDI